MRRPKTRRLFLELLESRIALNSYFVSPTGNDMNAGTMAAPWRTLQHAADQLVAGDNVTVETGTYAGFSMGWNFAQNGTAAAPIVWNAQPGVVINAKNPNTADGIDLEGSSYITINGFDVENPASGTITRTGIRAVSNGITNAQGVILENNTANNCGTWGIITSHEDGILVQNNICSNAQQQHGIYIGNASVGPIVRGNTVFGNHANGIHMNGDLSQGGTGLITGALVEDNIIHDNGVAGGSGINCDGVQSSIIRNNLLYNNHASGISLYDIDAAAGAINNVVVNNTIVMPSGSRWALNIQNASTGNTAFNNILYNGGSHGSIAISADSLSGFTSNFNVVVNQFSPDGGNNIFDTLAQWQTATGQDKNSIISTPAAVFVNVAANNYQELSTSPSVDAGASSLAGHNAPAIDLLGTTRPQGLAWDIGAYELITSPPGVTTHFSISAPASTTAGSAFSVTVTALDAFNNTAPAYLGTIHFTSSDSAAVLPANYMFTAGDAGVHTFANAVILKTAGSKSVTAKDTLTSSITGSASLTVNPATASTLLVSGYPSPTTAGASHSFTVTAKDAFGNTATGYTGTVSFSSTDAKSALPGNYTFVVGDAGLHSFSAALKTAGPQSITATDTVTSSLKGSQNIAVNSAAASKLVVNSFPLTTTAGVSQSVKVTAQDPFGNTAMSYAGTIAFTSTDSQAVLPGNYTFVGGDAGAHTFSATLKTAGVQSIMATDTVTSSLTGTESGITVNHAAMSGFILSAPGSVTANHAFTITLTAVDPFRNIISGYLGTVHFTSSDGQAVLPANYTFVAADAGVHVFTNGVTLKSVGSQTVTATDTVTSSLTGQATITVNSGTLTPALVGRISSNGQVWAAVSNGSSAFTNSLWATMPTTVTWVDVVTGDFNGDGKTDIAARVQQTGFWWVGTNTGSAFALSRWGQWSTAVTWVDVKVGDFTGDGKDDIAGRVQPTGKWWVANSLGSSFNNTVWGAWPTTVTWVDVNVGDFDGDGKADLTGRVLETGRWWTGLSTGSSFNFTVWDQWATAVTWVDVNVGDFNGDGKSDLTGRVLETGRWWVAVSIGSTAFTSTPWGTAWPITVTWVDVKVGDFNGDGKADITGRVLQTGRWWTGLNTGSNSFNFTVWDTWSTDVTWVNVQVGDFNGDGKADIVGRVLPTGRWWVGQSFASNFISHPWGMWFSDVSWVDVQFARNL